MGAIEKVHFPSTAPKLIRVAGYARVSSGKEAMLHSLSAQVSYYSDYIQRHKGWQYAGVYADEAVTGTKSNRENFQRLLTDCREGKVDMVVTKSISRFARNTITLLETVRELKERGIDVFFEEQNIHTLSASGELMITILASYAQEESRSASENQKWRIKKNFEEGMPWNGIMLGYRYDHGKFIVVPEEAEIVKRIYSDYLSGLGLLAIVKSLKADGIKTRRGFEWGKTSIANILKNYSYTGNLFLQRTYRKNHLTKCSQANRGELPMYHALATHEAIIPLETFNEVQAEISRRSLKHNENTVTRNHYPFAGKIVCGNCNKHYRRRKAHGQPVWICSTFNSLGKAYCASKQITEDILYAITAEVLGIDCFDENTFCDKITEIRVKENNTLVFVYKDGKESIKQWQDRSRADSWTDEMKSIAREKRKLKL